MKKENVAVLGASPKKDRYSNRAINMLLEYGHTVYPIHPIKDTIEGLKVYHSLSEIQHPIDTLTVYVGPKNMQPLIQSIVTLNPKRVILNPGTESRELIEKLNENNILYVEACTLVMLSTNQF